MQEQEALAALVGAYDAEAHAALDWLFQSGADRLTRFVVREFQAQPADAADVVQQVFLKILRSRRRLEFPDSGSWRRFTEVVARNCWLDRVRSLAPTLALCDASEVPAEDSIDPALSALRHATELRMIRRVADTLWLDLPPGEPDDVRSQRLLCAQLFYLKGATLEQTIRLTLGPRESTRGAGRKQVEAWLMDPPTIRLLAASRLSIPVERLLWSILFPGVSFDAAELNRLTERVMADDECAEAPVMGDWRCREVRVLLAHYRFGQGARSIAGSQFGGYEIEEIESVLVRSSARLPFRNRMATLLDILDRKAPETTASLQSAGLWRRLVFEYGHVECVPHKEIVAWLSPVAEMAGYRGVTESNVNVLISGQRLLGQLSSACRAALGDEVDD